LSCILGLDVSTSCTGICVLDADGNPILLSSVDLSKSISFIDKCSKIQFELSKIQNEFKIDELFIEQDLQAFRPGLSSAHVINTLSRFNGAVSLICFQVFNIRPLLINVTNARNCVGIKINHKDKSKTTKEKVWEWVANRVKFDWQFKKTGKLKTNSFDIADAYVIAYSGFLDCKDTQSC